jgi:hypothetical protein
MPDSLFDALPGEPRDSLFEAAVGEPRDSLFEAAVGEPAESLFAGAAGEPAGSQFEVSGDEGTLDELLARVWRALGTHATAACPVCGAELEPEYGAHALPVGARCSDCGSTLT